MELDNVTTGSGAEPESAETFHIYILSFAYGILIVVVLGHLVVRWHWRRKKLSHFRPHTPGDKSFWSKGIRERISADFTAIKAISPDPRLVSDSFKPSEFGANSDGAGATPPHWYRMKAFDVAADFVATNSPLLRTPTPPPPPPRWPHPVGRCRQLSRPPVDTPPSSPSPLWNHSSPQAARRPPQTLSPLTPPSTPPPTPSPPPVVAPAPAAAAAQSGRGLPLSWRCSRWCPPPCQSSPSAPPAARGEAAWRDCLAARRPSRPAL